VIGGATAQPRAVSITYRAATPACPTIITPLRKVCALADTCNRLRPVRPHLQRTAAVRATRRGIPPVQSRRRAQWPNPAPAACMCDTAQNGHAGRQTMRLLKSRFRDR